MKHREFKWKPTKELVRKLTCSTKWSSQAPSLFPILGIFSLHYACITESQSTFYSIMDSNGVVSRFLQSYMSGRLCINLASQSTKITNLNPQHLHKKSGALNHTYSSYVKLDCCIHITNYYVWHELILWVLKVPYNRIVIITVITFNF